MNLMKMSTHSIVLYIFFIQKKGAKIRTKIGNLRWRRTEEKGPRTKQFCSLILSTKLAYIIDVMIWKEEKYYAYEYMNNSNLNKAYTQLSCEIGPSIKIVAG